MRDSNRLSVKIKEVDIKNNLMESIGSIFKQNFVDKKKQVMSQNLSKSIADLMKANKPILSGKFYLKSNLPEIENTQSLSGNISLNQNTKKSRNYSLHKKVGMTTGNMDSYKNDVS